MRAAHAFHEMLGGLVFRAERQAAGTAEFVVAGLQTVSHRYALIENEAVTPPEARILGHGLQIFKDAAFQVIDLVVAERTHVSGRLLAAYASRTEHGHLALSMEESAFGTLLFYPAGELGKASCFGVNRALERADLILVVVTR